MIARKNKEDVKIIRKCKGYVYRSGNPKDDCGHKCHMDTDFCKTHQYMNDYTEEQFNKMTYKCSPSCGKKAWRYYDGLCDTCDAKQCKINRYLGHTDYRCKFKHMKGEEFCRHHIKMKNYTEYMFKNLRHCEGGKHYGYIEINKATGKLYKKCIHCNDHARKQAQKRRKNVVYCEYDGCTNKQKKGKYCMLHYERETRIDNANKLGKKLCIGHIRGCRNMLEMDDYQSCEDCRRKERIYDTNQRYSIKLDNIYKRQQNEKLTCVVCIKCHDIDMFITRQGVSDVCQNCRDKNLEYENQRNRNYIKDNYLKWESYRKGAAKRVLHFELSYNMFEQLVNTNCYYCGIKPEITFDDNGSKYSNIGIDRINNELGYVVGNVCSCCTMCNMMKHNLSYDDFIACCTNIKNNIGCMHYSYGGYHHASFRAKRYRATKRGIKFKINEKKYNEIIRHKCYYCGNNNNSITRDIGIDRYYPCEDYSNKSLLVACCYRCNIMKKNYDANAFNNKIKQIVSHTNEKDSLKIYLDKQVKQFGYQYYNYEYEYEYYEDSDEDSDSYENDIIYNEIDEYDYCENSKDNSDSYENNDIHNVIDKYKYEYQYEYESEYESSE
jgi:hypothetical protein